MKSGKPGVSIRWMRVPSISKLSTDERSECCQDFSSGSKSLTVVPRSTLPATGSAFARTSKASASVVLPDAPCPTSATVRMFSVAYCAMPAPDGSLPGVHSKQNRGGRERETPEDGQKAKRRRNPRRLSLARRDASDRSRSDHGILQCQQRLGPKPVRPPLERGSRCRRETPMRRAAPALRADAG